MQNTNLDQTQPNIPVPQPQKKKGAGKFFTSTGKVFAFIFAFLLVVGLAGFFGYQAAISARLEEQARQNIGKATEQYKLALEDINAGRLELAQKRLVYIIELSPGFPGAGDKLTEVMVKLSIQKTPTVGVTPTPDFTPTPDTRGEDEVFNQIVALVQNKQWNDAYTGLMALRNKNPGYKAIEMDGLFFVTLRNRGVQKILQEGDLQGGSYDISLANVYAPVDKDAISYREWAELYLTGGSYWMVNWEKAIFYFKQLYQGFPDLRDGSGRTAFERYYFSLVKYGDVLWEQKKWCRAESYYSAALGVIPGGELEQTAEKARIKCLGPSPTPTTEITPTLEVITETPTEAPTEIPTETPVP